MGKKKEREEESGHAAIALSNPYSYESFPLK